MHLLHAVLWMMVSVVFAYGPHHPRPGHGHHRVDRSVKITQDQKLLQDKEHIREDLEGSVGEDVADKLTPEELEFYYFRVHDSDNNTKLDGLEILNAVQHASHNDKEADASIENIEEIIHIIDRVLDEDDFDKDGYLSYVEYVQGRNREERSRTHKLNSMGAKLG